MNTTIKLGNTELSKGFKIMVKEVAKQTIGCGTNPFIEKEIDNIVTVNRVTFKGSKVEYYTLYSRFGYLYFEAVSGRKTYTTKL